MKISSTLSRRIALALACVLILASCSLPVAGTSSGAPQAWLDQPTAASLLPLAPFTLKAHARPAGTDGGVTKIEFLVNDVPVGSVTTDPSQPLVYAETSWNPSAAGSYTISARAYAGNGSGDSAVARVCVSDQVATPSAGFMGSCSSPVAGAGASITATPAPSGPTVTPAALPVTVSASVVYDTVYYGSCEPSTLKVKASLSGDLSAVDTVRVSYLYDTPTSTSPFGLGDVAYDANIMTRQPDGTYLWGADTNIDATRWGLSGAPYVLYVYVEAFSSAFGGVSNQAGPIAVRWLPCPASVPPTPTFTPASFAPPTVTITGVDPSDTAYYLTGCGPNAITVRAHVTIAPGPSTVTLVYRYSDGTSGSITMGTSGGGDYSASLPMDMGTYNALHGVTGTVTFTVNANDSHGNSGSAASGPVTLMYCPG